MVALQGARPKWNKGERPQIFTDVRTRDVGSDRRDDTWSPGNMLVDTVARMQQDLAVLQAENRLLRTPVVPPVVHTSRQAAFTTTKVPRFGGMTSWEQYRQIFDAIVLFNGWDDATAALQLRTERGIVGADGSSDVEKGTGGRIVGTLWVAG